MRAHFPEQRLVIEPTVEGDLNMENYSSKRSAPQQENPPERKQAKLSGREKHAFVFKW